jgi:hypothetical protein
MAIALGADINATQFVWYNLIPATLGNWIGGGIAVATTYAFIFGTPPTRMFAWLAAKGAPAWLTGMPAAPPARPGLDSCCAGQEQAHTRAAEPAVAVHSSAGAAGDAAVGAVGAYVAAAR